MFFNSYKGIWLQCGLIGAWPFSGNANDISGSANHGTVTGASLTTDRCGNSNSAYHFNGTSNSIRMLSAGPTGSVSRSLSFWAATTNTNLMCLFAYGNTAAGQALGYQYNYNCQGVGIDVNNNALTRGNSCVNDGQWHHIVAIINATAGVQVSSVDFYVDATLLTSITCTISGTTQTINTGSNHPITLGRLHDSFSRYFSGDMDDMYLYNRVLSISEIQQLYTACSVPVFGNSVVCQSVPTVYSITPIANASYTWSLPSGWTGSSSTNTILASAGSMSGAVSVSVTNGCGSIKSTSFAVNVHAIQIAMSPANLTICLGKTATLESVKLIV